MIRRLCLVAALRSHAPPLGGAAVCPPDMLELLFSDDELIRPRPQRQRGAAASRSRPFGRGERGGRARAEALAAAAGRARLR